MANHLAIRLDRRGIAEMSCIAGVGGDVPKLVRTARSGRRIIAIDGCVLACVRNCLARHDVVAETHHILSDLGVRKRYSTDFDQDEAERALDEIVEGLAPKPAHAVAEDSSCLIPRFDDAIRLCCTNRVRDSSCESSVIAEKHEQTHTTDLQDPELASLQ
jgi:uncharacterized metal-binding protein